MHVDNLIILEFFYSETGKIPVRYMPLSYALSKYDEFNINLDKKTWSYKHSGERQIGNARGINFNNDRTLEGIIGVYDKTNLEHINNGAKQIFKIVQNLQLA